MMNRISAPCAVTGARRDRVDCRCRVACRVHPFRGLDVEVMREEHGMPKALLLALICQVCLYYADLYEFGASPIEGAPGSNRPGARRRRPSFSPLCISGSRRPSSAAASS